MSKRLQVKLGTLELIILIVLKQKTKASGMMIWNHFKAKGISPSSQGAIYTTLGRLEKKGVVYSHWQTEPNPGRGDRRQRMYQLTERGRLYLKETITTIQLLWEDMLRTTTE